MRQERTQSKLKEIKEIKKSEKQYLIEIEQIDNIVKETQEPEKRHQKPFKNFKISTLRENHPLDYLNKGPLLKAKSPKPPQTETPNSQWQLRTNSQSQLEKNKS